MILTVIVLSYKGMFDAARRSISKQTRVRAELAREAERARREVEEILRS